MLNYKLFFDLVEAEEFAEIKDNNALIHAVTFAAQDSFQWKQVDIALVGINLGGEANAVRHQLFRLQKSGVRYRILDLGNLRLGNDYQDNVLKISEVNKFLMQSNILPLLIGGGNEFALGQYLAYQDLEKMIYVLLLDRQLDIVEGSPNLSEKYVSKILLHQPNYLFNLGLIGYQNYLNSYQALEMSKSLHFDLLSVGEIRNNLPNTEPMIRMADMMSIDIATIRRNDAPAQHYPFHFGLTSEEVVQLAWYAGLNEKLSSLGIFGYRADLDKNGQTAEVIAVMLWYFIEGFYYRKGEFPMRENFYVKYIVPFFQENLELIFYKSILTEKWWIEMPDSQRDDTVGYHRKTLIPCSYQDYEEANKGNLPDRWLKAITRS
jgi:formiminoglutamase